MIRELVAAQLCFLCLLVSSCLAETSCVDGSLGMATGDIKDWQITASSTYPPSWDPSCHEKYSRLYAENGKAWCAKHRSDAEWLQIDLGVAAKITGVLTQGRTGKQEWVSSFMISYSTDAFQWQYITDKYGNQKIFLGNSDDSSIKHNYFDQAINARFIKFHTVQWNRHPSLRVEVIGCQECKQLLAIPPYGRFKASSVLAIRNKRTCQPNDGFLHSNKAWCPKKRNPNGQWLELDIGHPTLVTGLVTKGKGDTQRNHWVTKYKVSFSNDSVLWTFYKDANHLEPKEFGGNADKHMERTHYLNNPFWARFVRFHPIQWNEQIAMRVGVIGCPHAGECLPGYFRVNENSNCVENIAYQKDAWANVRKPPGSRHVDRRRTSIRTRSYLNLIQDGHPSLAVDGNDDNSLHNCAIMDNYYTEKPTLIIDLGRMTNVGGVVIKTWQGKGQDSNFAYRDYMYGLDRFSVYVDKRPYNNQHLNYLNSHKAAAGDDQSRDLILNDLNNNNMSTIGINGSIVVKEASQNTARKMLSLINSRVKLNEANSCNYVTRNNYAIFTPHIHLQCNRPLYGRYLYIQAEGRSNRWTRLFSAVVCEVQVYEL